MEEIDGLFQIFRIQVGVNFGGRDALMSQHILDRFEVGTSFYEVGGEGVPEGMRADVFGDARCRRYFLNDQKHHDAAELLAAPIEEDKVFMTGLNVDF